MEDARVAPSTEQLVLPSSFPRLLAFANRFQDFPPCVREEMIAQCTETVKRRLDAVPQEIDALRIHLFPGKRRELVGVMDAARRVGIDVGEHESRLAELDAVVEGRRGAMQRMSARREEMEGLRRRLAALEEEDQREREALTLLQSQFCKMVGTPWETVDTPAAAGELTDEDTIIEIHM